MPIVTISQGTHAGAAAIAELVSGKLDAPLVTREHLVRDAEEFGIPMERLTRTFERPSFFERYTMERDIYLLFVRTALLRQATRGSFVYQGHSAHLLLENVPDVIRVRVVAPLSYRIKAVMQNVGLDEKQARRYIGKMDKKRAKWTRFLYDADWRDPSLYDLTINLDSITADQGADIIRDLASLPHYEGTEGKRKQLADLALASTVLLKVLQDCEIRRESLDVAVAEGVVTITGATRFESVRDAIRKAAESVDGVQQLDCRISIPADILAD